MATATAARKLRLRRTKRPGSVREGLTGYAFVVIPMAVFILFFIYPMGYAIYISRYDWGILGPLGSVGDRLVWASWLPFCSLVGIGVYGVGGSPMAVVGTFLLLYNAGHFFLRAWGLRIGLSRGLNVA